LPSRGFGRGNPLCFAVLNWRPANQSCAAARIHGPLLRIGGAGPSIKKIFAALFVGKRSRASMHDGVFLSDGMIDRTGLTTSWNAGVCPIDDLSG
jgi:hypothetical protein